MATGQNTSYSCRSIKLFFLLFGCSCSTTLLLLCLVTPCDAGEQVGEPEPAPPFAGAVADSALTPDDSDNVETGDASELASPIPAKTDAVDGKDTTEGREVETDSAAAALPDDPIRCALPRRTIRHTRTIRCIGGINSVEYCQKLCVLQSNCIFVEWNLVVGICYLKALDDVREYLSYLSPRSTSTSNEGNKAQSALIDLWSRPRPQDGGARVTGCEKHPQLGSSAGFASGQAGSPASALPESCHFSLPYSRAPAGMSQDESTLPLVRKTLLSEEGYAGDFVPRTLATSLPQSSSSLLAPPPQGSTAAANVADQNKMADWPSSQQGPPAFLVASTTDGLESASGYYMADLVEPHWRHIVAPRTCGVSCWVSRYTCREMPKPMKSGEAEAQTKAKSTAGGNKTSTSSKASKKEGATADLTYSPPPTENVFTPYDCQALCEMADGCGAFSWNRYSNQCIFCPVTQFPVQSWPSKKAFFAAVERHLRPDRAYITGPKQSCSVSGLAEWGTPVFQQCFHGNKATQSASVTVIDELSSIPTPADCQTECAARSNCLHFTWEFNTQKCTLKAGSIHDSLVPASGSITGPRSCFRGCFKHDVSYRHEAVIATIITSSVFDCQVACAARTNPRCGGVTYHFATHTCDLAATPAAAVHVTDATSPSVPSASFVSSSKTQLAPALLESSARGGHSLREEAASRWKLDSQSPSLVSTEVRNSAGALKPDVECDMCVSASAGPCYAAIPEGVYAEAPAAVVRRGIPRSRGLRSRPSMSEKK